MGKKEKKKKDSKKDDRKKRKKEDETPEERQQRRLEKKLRKAKNSEAASATLMGYSNESNPFGDSNLHVAFVWKKKYEKDIAAGKTTGLTKADVRKKQEALREEIEEVKRRREKREIEKAEMEQMREQTQRDAAWEENQDWEEKEEQFHLEQAKIRSEIRIREGREKAIDILAKNLTIFNRKRTDEELLADLDVELTEPYKIFNGLSLSDLDDLKRDIEVQLNLGANGQYWKALLVVCEDEILRAARREDLGLSSAVNSSDLSAYGLHQSVADEVIRLLQGKTKNQLESLEIDIRRKLDQKETGPAVDVAFWEALIKQLSIFKARAYLREFHADLLRKRLKQLKEQQAKEVAAKKASGLPDEEDDFEPELLSPEQAKKMGLKVEGDEEDEKKDEIEQQRSFSPQLEYHNDELEAVAIDAEQDEKELEAARRVVLAQKESLQNEEKQMKHENAVKKKQQDPGVALRAAGMNRFQLTENQLVERAKKEMTDMDEEEEAFNDEDLSLPSQPYWWHDKYRPRKPRFFNRVKTGFEWNKYNQTHYDKENPPPKIVQGYKFNIFYPDLIDSAEAPTYHLEPCDNNDYCIIRFKAGPPYEDIAFKIVKKDWEYSHKRGFKCVFDRGVLHLYFNFRKYRYRR